MLLLVCFNALSSLGAIIVLGCGYSVSFIYGKRNGVDYSSRTSKSIKEALKENWAYGKWALLGVASGLLQERGYIYIVSGLLGLSNVADIAAARLFLMPINLLNVGSARIAVAKGSKILATNRNHEFRKFFFWFVALLLLITIIYIVFIILASDLLIDVLGKKYVNTQGLIFLWSIFYLIFTIRYQLGMALVAYRQFKIQARYDIYGSTIAIASCFILVLEIGRAGAIISLMLGEFVTMIFYLKLYLGFKK